MRVGNYRAGGNVEEFHPKKDVGCGEGDKFVAFHTGVMLGETFLECRGFFDDIKVVAVTTATASASYMNKMR